MLIKQNKIKQFVSISILLPLAALFLLMAFTSCKTCKCPAYSYNQNHETETLETASSSGQISEDLPLKNVEVILVDFKQE